ncbi:MAG: large subunit ribosomal protein [Solirubrobacterales bacterium]|jgi:ribosomal protein L22|nr:large subunit ribosomal protein [Solirubrobacterales bacterium]
MADEKKDSKAKKAAKPAAKKATKPAAKKESAPKKEAKAKKAPAKKAAKKPAAKKESKKAEGKQSSKAKKEPAKKAAKTPAAKAKAPAAPPVVKAKARYVRIAPRKARLIADQVRGMHIEKARALLQFSPRGAAHDIHKLINSAAANAENNHDLVGDEMRVASITVDEGPTLRRFRPRAMGRATPINKRTSHIAVALTPVED